LLAWGSRDPVLPWWIDGRRARRALPDADVTVFRCGHQPFVEMPDEFCAALEGFLNR
jgi:pimeloyl-ACP methyl ester carboxylesterase